MRDYPISRQKALSNAVYSLCNEGASFNWDFETAKSGYMVSKCDVGLVYDTAVDVNPHEVESMIKKHLGQKEIFVGVWRDTETGKYYFDISVNVQDENTALEMAKIGEQLAIWDVKNSKEIRL